VPTRLSMRHRRLPSWKPLAHRQGKTEGSA